MKMLEPEALLAELSKLVADEMGLHFPKERWRDLERGIKLAAKQLGFGDPIACVKWLLSSSVDQNAIEILASHLTVGETYFFREKQAFDILKEQVIPELISKRHSTKEPMRIWSAGCCTGEEPYSIAILLREMVPSIDSNAFILGTDINPLFLQKAREGLYKSWSFRGSPDSIRKRYFIEKKKELFQINSSIKKMVTLSYLNLAKDSYPSLLNHTNAMDVIFCRNVLIYFGENLAKKVVENFYRSLVDGGWLIVSPVETSQTLFSSFESVHFPDVVFYRKEASKVIPLSLQTPSTLANDPISIMESSEPEVEIIEPEPSTEITLYEAALLHYKQGHYSEATKKITAHLVQKPYDESALVLLARIYANEGKFSLALQVCERAIAHNKINPIYQYLRANIFEEQGNLEQAKDSLRKALYLNQDFVLAHYALGILYRQEKRIEESEKYFKNTLALLKRCAAEEILPESDGMTASRLTEIIESTIFKEVQV